MKIDGRLDALEDISIKFQYMVLIKENLSRGPDMILLDMEDSLSHVQTLTCSV